MAQTPDVVFPVGQLRALRERFGLNRAQFAAIIPVTYDTVLRWETTTAPRPVRARTAAELLALAALPDPIFAALAERVHRVFAARTWPDDWNVWTVAAPLGISRPWRPRPRPRLQRRSPSRRPASGA